MSALPSSPSPVRTTVHGRVLRGMSVAVTGVLALALAGCSGGEGASAPESSASSAASPSATSGPPTPTGFALPDGVELAEAGSELSLGEPATVAVEPSRARGSALTLTVTEIRQGRTSDLNAYVLNDRAKKATPFYVDVTVVNEGPGDLGGYAVPLYGQFDDSSIVESTTFATPFDTCDSAGLPDTFGPGKSAERCLVFLIPASNDLQGVAFARAGFEPIAWSGSITAPPQQKSSKSSGKKSNG